MAQIAIPSQARPDRPERSDGMMEDWQAGKIDDLYCNCRFRIY
jgi:hypothetical protein